jgi:osmotically-inducible protein OsmY
MKSDTEIENDVKAELRWSPDVDETDVAVNVAGGVVALTGFVHSLFEKFRAEAAAKRVAGVSAIANDIQVRVPLGDGRTDPEIARDAVSAIRSAIPIAADQIRVLVADGKITIEGKVEWQYQREAAESAVRNLRGARSVENVIQIVPRVSATNIQRQIAEAFRRSAAVDANSITVDAHGGEVTLKGKVRSYTEREQAQRTAWSAPGVTRVQNEIQVGA